MKKLITIVSPTFNEENNITELYERLKLVISQNQKYEFEIIIIDNCSTDSTVDKLKSIAIKDDKLKIILNTRNFGHIRSPYWGILSASGDAVVYLASDLQDPPDLINKFILEWEKGWKIILGVKPESKSNKFLHYIRVLYYIILSNISDISITKNATGFGLYDKTVIEILKKINDPYPFFRGLIAELGYPIKEITFIQSVRKSGVSKNNFITLYDNAMLGVVSHSTIPLRMSSYIGYVLAICIFVYIVLTCIMKSIGFATPDNITLFLILLNASLFSLLFIVIGLIGEYINLILLNVKRRPIVIENKRINF